MIRETVTVAAIHFKGYTYSVPNPGRHCDVLQLIFADGYKECFGETQGFLTSTNRFVDRYEAMKIAKCAKQLKAGKFNAKQLFSEDLW